MNDINKASVDPRQYVHVSLYRLNLLEQLYEIDNILEGHDYKPYSSYLDAAVHKKKIMIALANDIVATRVRVIQLLQEAEG